jgi:hypothetical protein
VTLPDDHAAGRGLPTGSNPAPPSPAQQLLTEITDRIARLQNDLAQRDARIAKLDTELAQTAAALLHERTTRARGIEDSARQLAAQLNAREKELESQRTAALAEVTRLQTRERDLQAQLATLKRQYDEARAALTAARDEADRLRTSIAKTPSTPADSRRAGTARNAEKAGSARPTVPGRPDDDVSDLLQRLDSEYAGSGTHAQRTRAVRLVLAIIVLAVAGGVGAIMWSHDKPLYRATALLIGAPNELEGLANHARTALADTASAQVEADAPAAVVRISLTAAQPDRATSMLAAAGSATMEAWRAARAASTQPANARAAELAARLADFDRRLARPQTQPASADSLATAVQNWRELIGQKQANLVAAQATATRAAVPSPDEQSLAIDAARLKAAESADPRLQADTSVLTQREEQLAGMLRASLEAGEPRFGKLTDTAAAAVKATREHEAPDAAETGAILKKIVQSVEAWSTSGAALAEGWRKAATELARPGADALAIHTALEPLARRFIDESASAADAVSKQLESLAQGGDEPTKRLVLRTALAHELQPALDAREALASAARTVLASENLELSAVRQRVAGLRTQVEQQRERIRENVKRTLLASARSAHDTDLAEAQRQRAALADRAAQLDAELLKSADLVLDRVEDAQSRLAAAAARADLYRQRGDLLKELAQLGEQAQARAAAAPRFITGPTERVNSPERRIARAVLAGLGALLLCAFGFTATGVLSSWRRSERELTRSLKTLEKVAK